MRYLQGEDRPSGEGHPDCPFCIEPSENHCCDIDNLIVRRCAHSFIMLNRYPYNNGHLMVVPNRHVASLAGCSPEELNEMMGLTRLAELALTEAYHPQGLNVGINIGRSAGAGVVDHVHIHAVPRWTGDTNFISVIGEVRVLPEELEETARRLRPIFERLATEVPGS